MREWADRYAGKFDDGWDAYRQRVFERAKERVGFRKTVYSPRVTSG